MSTITADGTTQTVYVEQYGLGVQYRIDNSSLLLIAWPATVVNSNPVAPLKVLFTTTITLDAANSYFICDSTNIQFGSATLNGDGTKPVLDVNGVLAYPGVFQNGTSGSNGVSDISIYNLTVNSTASALAVGGGWVAQSYFSKGALNNLIVNCNSNGSITVDSAGGIAGDQVGGNAGGLSIIGCSNSGSTIVSGGIVGASAGIGGGEVDVFQCFTSGVIGTNAGGIFGINAGNTGYVSASNCYSTGLIDTSGGGIFGASAAIGSGQVQANNCYSTGAIGTSAGGIYGANAASPAGSATANNCYSTGSIPNAAGGIFGANFDTTAIASNCYTSGDIIGVTDGGIYSNSSDDNLRGADNYSEGNNDNSGSWSSVNANAHLTGIPSPIVGTTWSQIAINTPYELTNMGYSPYTAANISAGPVLTRTFSQTITAGTATSAALLTASHTFTLLVAPATVTISSGTGAITANSTTPSGTYTLFVRDSVNPYSITEYILIVLGLSPAPAGATTTANCCAPVTRSSDYSFGWMYNVQEGNTSITEQAKTQAIRFTSYDAYMRYVMSLGTRR
jgi:hypothetical protein